MTSTDQLLRAAPAALGALAALLRSLPTAANRVRSSRGRDHEDSTALRVLSLQGPPAWQPGVEGIFVNDEAANRAHVHSKVVCILGIAVPVVAFVAYMSVGVNHDLPWWSYGIAAAVTAWVAGLFVRGYLGLRADGRATVAEPQGGEVLVSGSSADVVQFALCVLHRMGARLVTVADGVIVAGTGLAVPGNRWLGNRLEVRVLPTGVPERHRVQIRCTKLDYVTPSRSRRDVVQLIGAFAAAPDGSTSRVTGLG